MIAAAAYLELLERLEVRSFAGVPDSILKPFCECLLRSVGPERHHIGAHEGTAVAWMTGRHLATGETGLVYLQNSGLGNAINPLVSLTHARVYAIPMILLVGWRGEPGRADECQHLVQGDITCRLLDLLEIPWKIHPESLTESGSALRWALASARKQPGPCALIVRSGLFESLEPIAERGTSNDESVRSTMGRRTAMEVILDAVESEAILVATTGFIARELYDLRRSRNEPDGRDFLTIGSMGHASQIACGIASTMPRRPVYCLDGDGALLMHLGGLGVIGNAACLCFRHLLFDNGVHESVGGQPIGALVADWPSVAAACGYAWTTKTGDEKELRGALAKARGIEGPVFIDVGIKPNLGSVPSRPEGLVTRRKASFMKWCQGSCSGS